MDKPFGSAVVMLLVANITMVFILAGCFYPPQQKPPTTERARVVVEVPYYRAWDALHQVVARNQYNVITEDPDRGMLEAQATGGFSLADADCGRLRGIAGKYAAQPDVDSSAIYDFEVKPHGNEAATVAVQATFTAPLQIPLHPPRGELCVSRGTQERRLLAEIARTAKRQSTSAFQPASPPLRARETVK